MHKYQPRVHVIRKDFSSDHSPTKPVPVGDGVKTFNFPETVFTTVTAYQNQQVRGCLWESPAAAAFNGVYSSFCKNCLVLLHGTEMLEWEPPGWWPADSPGDDKAVMPGSSCQSLDLDQRQDLWPRGPNLSHFQVSLYLYPCFMISTTSWQMFLITWNSWGLIHSFPFILSGEPSIRLHQSHQVSQTLCQTHHFHLYFQTKLACAHQPHPKICMIWCQ